MSDYQVTRRGRLALTTAIVLVLVAVLAVAAYGADRVLTRDRGAADFDGPGTGVVRVVVRDGDTSRAIGTTLERAGVVASVGAFTAAADADARARGIQPGTYRLRSHMSGAGALGLLLSPAARVRSGFTVPEGTSLKNLPAIIAAGTAIPVAQVRAALAHPSALGLPGYAQGSVEGFLFPSTYEVEPGTSATTVLRDMVARFEQTADTVGLVDGAASLGISPLKVVTVASVIQRETAAPADAPRVARVFYNRLAAGMGLGSEFTVAYAGGDPRSPYNTYTNKAYPPGPYDSPGQAALEAALHPAAGSWHFFVTLPKEGTRFVDTDDEFVTLQATCRAEGGCRG